MVNKASANRARAVWIFIEGGGNSRDEQGEIRKGFATLLGRALAGRQRPTVIPSGGRDQTFRAWQRALRTDPDKLSVLLVDSEGPIPEGALPWAWLKSRTGDTHWTKPAGTSDDQLHLMVQAMEAWFFADPEALARYYDKGFQASALPARKDVENILKQDLEKTLEHASRSTKKGAYKKSHGFALIGQIDPVKIRAASPHAARFFDHLLAVCPVR